MKQYIDKSVLLAEIERKIKQYEKAFDSPSFASYEASLIAKGKYRKLLDIIQFLDTLETKEVDLEKEVRNYMTLHNLHIKDGGRVVFENNDSPNFMCDIRNIAKHFFELGLKAQKPAFETDDSIGSPDYERGFKHGRDFQTEIDVKCTDVQKVINYLINEKGYPINTQGDIPSYEETFKFALNALEAQKGD